MSWLLKLEAARCLVMKTIVGAQHLDRLRSMEGIGVIPATRPFVGRLAENDTDEDKVRFVEEGLLDLA